MRKRTWQLRERPLFHSYDTERRTKVDLLKICCFAGLQSLARMTDPDVSQNASPAALSLPPNERLQKLCRRPTVRLEELISRRRFGFNTVLRIDERSLERNNQKRDESCPDWTADRRCSQYPRRFRAAVLAFPINFAGNVTGKYTALIPEWIEKKAAASA